MVTFFYILILSISTPTVKSEYDYVYGYQQELTPHVYHVTYCLLTDVKLHWQSVLLPLKKETLYSFVWQILQILLNNVMLFKSVLMNLFGIYVSFLNTHMFFLQFFKEGLNVIEVHDDQKNKVLTVYNNGEVMPCNFSEKVRPCVNSTRDLIVQAGLENGTYVVHLMTSGIKQFAGWVCFDHNAVHVICNIIIHIYIVLTIPKL